MAALEDATAAPAKTAPIDQSAITLEVAGDMADGVIPLCPAPVEDDGAHLDPKSDHQLMRALEDNDIGISGLDGMLINPDPLAALENGDAGNRDFEESRDMIQRTLRHMGLTLADTDYGTVHGEKQ